MQLTARQWLICLFVCLFVCCVGSKNRTSVGPTDIAMERRRRRSSRGNHRHHHQLVEGKQQQQQQQQPQQHTVFGHRNQTTAGRSGDVLIKRKVNIRVSSDWVFGCCWLVCGLFVRLFVWLVGSLTVQQAYARRIHQFVPLTRCGNPNNHTENAFARRGGSPTPPCGTRAGDAGSPAAAAGAALRMRRGVASRSRRRRRITRWRWQSFYQIYQSCYRRQQRPAISGRRQDVLGGNAGQA